MHYYRYRMFLKASLLLLNLLCSCNSFWMGTIFILNEKFTHPSVQILLYSFPHLFSHETLKNPAFPWKLGDSTNTFNSVTLLQIYPTMVKIHRWSFPHIHLSIFNELFHTWLLSFEYPWNSLAVLVDDYVF